MLQLHLRKVNLHLHLILHNRFMPHKSSQLISNWFLFKRFEEEHTFRIWWSRTLWWQWHRLLYQQLLCCYHSKAFLEIWHGYIQCTKLGER